ncbi:MAG: putative N-acetyltransferase [Proteobacteria bacterium]|nr:putative N-acetyltransferase [Pseudomonadota bacterium]
MSDALPALAGRGIRLRPLTQADAADLFDVFSDPRVMRYWSREPFRHLDEARRLVEDIEAGWRGDTLYQWGIEPDGAGRIVGTTTLFQISTAHRRAEIGFALGSAWWGRGFARAAVERLIAHAFETQGLGRLEADVDPRNAASLGLLERLGFRREGLLRERYRVAGEVQDSVILGLLRTQWTPP